MEDHIVSEEELQALSAQLTKKNQSFLDGRKFEIKLSHSDKFVFVTVTLSNDDQSFFYPVELRIDCQREEILPRKAALHLIDYADLYYEDFLAERDNLLLPIDWTMHEYDTVEFEMRGQIQNKKLESLADEILAEAEKKTL